jgi:hypothetical protein
MKHKPKIDKAFGSWQVLENGDIRDDENDFFISSDRLNESDWWGFLLAADISLDNFVRAYFHACRIAKIEKVVINVNNF